MAKITPKTEAKKDPAKQKADEAKKAAKSTKKAVVFDDLHTQADDQADVGHFVEVAKGKHEGRYGTLLEVGEKGNSIIRTRDEFNERLVVPYEDLKPSRAGKR